MAWYDEVTTWWPLKLDRLAKDSSHCFLACVAQISIRKTDDKQRRRRKREGLKKQCCSLLLVHFFAVTERLRSQNAVFQSFTADVYKWQRTFLSLFKLGLSSSEFISRRLRLYLTKSAKGWKNHDNGSKNAKLVLFLLMFSWPLPSCYLTRSTMGCARTSRNRFCTCMCCNRLLISDLTWLLQEFRQTPQGHPASL